MYISVRLRLSFVILLVCDITSYVMNVHLEHIANSAGSSCWTMCAQRIALPTSINQLKSGLNRELQVARSGRVAAQSLPNYIYIYLVIYIYSTHIYIYCFRIVYIYIYIKYMCIYKHICVLYIHTCIYIYIHIYTYIYTYIYIYIYISYIKKIYIYMYVIYVYILYIYKQILSPP